MHVGITEMLRDIQVQTRSILGNMWKKVSDLHFSSITHLWNSKMQLEFYAEEEIECQESRQL